MSKLKYIMLLSIALFFIACGTDNDVNHDNRFDLWEYMTSSKSYDVEYDIYENNRKTDYYRETHRQYGDEYERQSESGTTKLYLHSRNIIMNEPTGTVDIDRFVYLGDKDIFHSPKLQLCTFEKFYDDYRTKNSTFYNVVQIACTTKSGVYQEFYYGYNEGIVSLYEKDGNYEKEYVKVSEKEIYN